MKAIAFAPLLGLTLLGAQAAHAAKAGITSEPFGTLPDGEKVTLYTLTNAKGAQVQILNYGAILKSIRVPDKNGNLGDVILGFDTLDGYVKDDSYQGVIAGRYANRIAKGHLVVDGKTYQLATNNAPNHLHGGTKGFNRYVWTAKPVTTGAGPALELRRYSPNGEEHYPGGLQTRVRYTLDGRNQLIISYRAVTNAPTVVNLTSHPYFNLKGAGLGTILGHQLKLYAARFTPIDKTSIPFGELRKVAGGPFDFRAPHTIGSRIGANDEQLKNGAGYDHNFVLDGPNGVLKRAARVEESTSGRVLNVWTTEPGLQFYSGNFLKGVTGKYGRKNIYRGGFCLEAQHFPDSPNEPKFPSTLLRPGQVYRQTTIYSFSTRK
jgi:aldose 1-epimerase